MVTMNRDERRTWDGMIRRSFHPSQWFYEDDDLDEIKEDRIMWVYKPDAVLMGRFDVGYWSPSREWVEDSTGHNRESAAKRVNFLNGGFR